MRPTLNANSLEDAFCRKIIQVTRGRFAHNASQ